LAFACVEPPAIQPDCHSSLIPFLCEKLTNGTARLDRSPVAIEGDYKKKEYYLPVIACEMISDLVDELCTA